ncbi:MAG: class I SAM-dependent methyltransferase [Chloroflexi bacterium]|nr:class I SAM-dependent methyltransferase [Chloroflexota bacterium]
MQFLKKLKQILPKFIRTPIRSALEIFVPVYRERKIEKVQRDAEYSAAAEECSRLTHELFGNIAEIFEERIDLISYIIQVAKNGVDGLWMEFGVFKGRSLNLIAKNIDQIVYGFDSFDGLPEDWQIMDKQLAKAGTFSLSDIPKVNENVELVVGLFQESLPAFLKKHSKPAAFVHIDCDLYSSARYVLSLLNFQPGTIILFDEYYNYPGWREGEYKAFQEFLADGIWQAKCIGYATKGWNAGFMIYK